METMYLNAAYQFAISSLEKESTCPHAVCWISLLYLEPAFRGKGYGIQLLARAVDFYRRQGRGSLRLLVAESNRTARAFYEREGFRQIGGQDAPAGRLLLLECPLRAIKHLD